MWLPTQIRVSEYTVIQRFDLLVAVAKVMRGNHFFYISSERGSIYGIPEEPYAIREIRLPPALIPKTSFWFRLDTLDANIIAEHVDFVLFKDIPWALIPATKLDEAVNYTPIFRPTSETRLWTLVDTVSKQEVEFVDLYAPDSKKVTAFRDVVRVLNSFFNNKRLLSMYSYVFPNMERSLTIQQVFSGRAVNGEKYIQLSYDDKRFGMLLFKNLFPFNKNDLLTIEIRERTDNPNIFEAMFQVVHDKNPIKYIIEGKVVEYTYGTFYNI